ILATAAYTEVLAQGLDPFGRRLYHAQKPGSPKLLPDLGDFRLHHFPDRNPRNENYKIIVSRDTFATKGDVAHCQSQFVACGRAHAYTVGSRRGWQKKFFERQPRIGTWAGSKVAGGLAAGSPWSQLARTRLKWLTLFLRSVRFVLSFVEAVQEQTIVGNGFLDELFEEEEFGAVDDRVDAVLKGLHRGECLERVAKHDHCGVASLAHGHRLQRLERQVFTDV